MYDLLIDKLRCYWIVFSIVPRGKELLPEKQLPWRILFAFPHASHQLLALGNCIHHVIRTVAKRRNLEAQAERTVAVAIGFVVIVALVVIIDVTVAFIANVVFLVIVGFVLIVAVIVFVIVIVAPLRPPPPPLPHPHYHLSSPSSPSA